MPTKNPELNRKHQRDWYKRNKAKKIAWNRARVKALYAWLQEYKSRLVCEICGENHVACLDFHHTDPKQKAVSISIMVSTKGWSKEKMQEEISKCRILCSNCHRKLHWEEKHAPVV